MQELGVAASTVYARGFRREIRSGNVWPIGDMAKVLRPVRGGLVLDGDQLARHEHANSQGVGGGVCRLEIRLGGL